MVTTHDRSHAYLQTCMPGSPKGPTSVREGRASPPPLGSRSSRALRELTAQCGDAEPESPPEEPALAASPRSPHPRHWVASLREALAKPTVPPLRLTLLAPPDDGPLSLSDREMGTLSGNSSCLPSPLHLPRRPPSSGQVSCRRSCIPALPGLARDPSADAGDRRSGLRSSPSPGGAEQPAPSGRSKWTPVGRPDGPGSPMALAVRGSLASVRRSPPSLRHSGSLSPHRQRS
eukprot:EG_transcript_14418